MYILVHEQDGLVSFDDSKSFEDFKKDKVIIEAAGGMVMNKKGELLMMLRRGKWDMPKGKWDPGETLEECALREVTEETGLSPLILKQKLQVTYHTYPFNDKTALKPSHWFMMDYEGEQPPIPQTEEDIMEVRWVDRETAKTLLNQSFPSIREMVEKYFL